MGTLTAGALLVTRDYRLYRVQAHPKVHPGYGQQQIAGTKKPSSVAGLFGSSLITRKIDMME